MPRNFFQQFTQMNVPKIVLNQVKNHNQSTGVLKKTRTSNSNSKAQMIAELEQLLKLLADVSGTNIQSNTQQFKDPIIEQLQDIEKRAIQQDYKEIQKLCMLAMGKRILNIELKRKRQEFQKKQKKKSQIEEFFRENRIKKFDYDSLVEQKILDNTLIVRPYSSGKGFIESGNDYSEIPDILTECEYIEVVREVNKIFFDIFSGKKRDKKTKVFDVLFKILWVPIIIFLTILITLPFYTFQNQEIILSILMGIIAVLLTIVTISTYLNVPNSNNQMQQSIQDTKAFFNALNRKNYEMDRQYEWRCPQNFMYLEVKFDYNILEKYKLLG